MPLSFSTLTADLQGVLKTNLPQIRLLLRRSPALGYTRITDLGKKVGTKYRMTLIVNFPETGRINEFEMYGRRDLSLIVDKTRTNFPVERDSVKAKAAELLPGCRTEDAYMYDGKEGVKVFMDDGGRIDILPHSLHIWCTFSAPVTAYCDWLLQNVYDRG